MKGRKVFIGGIDPAFREKGFAICTWDLFDNSVSYKIFKNYIEFQKWLPAERDRLKADGYRCFIGVENANDQKGVFGIDAAQIKRTALYLYRNKKVGTRWTPRKAPDLGALIGYLVSQIKIWAQRGTSVGKVQAASQYTYETCVHYFGEENTFSISPKRKGAKIENDKIYRAYWRNFGVQEMYNYKGNKNEQDKRDAGKIAVITYELARRYVKRN